MTHFVVTHFLPLTIFVDFDVDFIIPCLPMLAVLLLNDENDVNLQMKIFNYLLIYMQTNVEDLQYPVFPKSKPVGMANKVDIIFDAVSGPR